MAPERRWRQAPQCPPGIGGTRLPPSPACCRSCRTTGCVSHLLATRRPPRRARLLRNSPRRRAECPAARSISPPPLPLHRYEMPGNYWYPNRLRSPGRVVLGLLGAGVVNGEATRGAGSQHEIVPLLGSLRIGDIFRGGVVLRCPLFGVVKLPKRLQTGCLQDFIDHLRRPALLRPVVHDGHPGMNSIDQGMAGTGVESVMGDDQNIDMS